jgi:hypothetical protein
MASFIMEMKMANSIWTVRITPLNHEDYVAGNHEVTAVTSDLALQHMIALIHERFAPCKYRVDVLSNKGKVMASQHVTVG